MRSGTRVITEQSIFISKKQSYIEKYKIGQTKKIVANLKIQK